MTGRKRCIKRILALLGLALLIYLVFPIRAAVPVLHLSYRFPHPVAGVPYRGWQQLRQDMPAVAAFDARGHFFLLTGKDKLLQVAQWDIRHGRCERAVPVRIESKQSINFFRYRSMAFSVSPSGKRWWLVHWYPEIQGRISVIALDKQGRLLQRWVVDVSSDDVIGFQAVGESRLLLLDTQQQIWEMKIGTEAPHAHTVPWGIPIIKPDGSIMLIDSSQSADTRWKVNCVDMKGGVTTVARFKCRDGALYQPFIGERSETACFYGQGNATTSPLVSLVERLPLLEGWRNMVLHKLLIDSQTAHAVDSSGRIRLLVAYPGAGQFFKQEKNGTVWFDQDLATKYDHEYLLLKTVRWPRALVWWRWFMVRRAMEERPADWAKYKWGWHQLRNFASSRVSVIDECFRILKG